MGLCAAIGFLSTRAASPPPAAPAHNATIPDKASEILKAIQEKQAELTKTVAAKKLADVHHLAFEIRDLAKALPAKAEASKKAQADGAVKNISTLADDLDASGDAKDQAKTEANLKKFDGVIKVLAGLFPDKAEDVLADIALKQAELTKTVAAKNLMEVHELAFDISDLAKKLPAIAEAAKKTQVQGRANNIAKLADDLDKAGDDGKQAETEALLKKLDGELKLLEAQFPKK